MTYSYFPSCRSCNCCQLNSVGSLDLSFSQCHLSLSLLSLSLSQPALAMTEQAPQLSHNNIYKQKVPFLGLSTTKSGSHFITAYS